MKLLTELTNIVNTGGTMNTVLWFFVALLATLVYVGSRNRYLMGTLVGGYGCMFVSLFRMDLTYQVLLFAAVVVFFALREASLPAHGEQVKEEKQNA